MGLADTSLRSRWFSSIDTWSVNTGYSLLDVPGSFVTNLFGNAVAKPVVWLGTNWRGDTQQDRIDTILVRQRVINQSETMGTAGAIVNLYASGTTDQIAFGGVGYDPYAEQFLGASERIQRIAGGTAGYTSTWIPVASAVRPMSLTVVAETTASATLRERVLANIAESQAARASSGFLQFDRQVVARQFYGNAGFTAERIASHLQGIDFTQPVRSVTIPYGATAQQFLGASGVGQYFSSLGTTPLEAGISPAGRVPVLFQSMADVPALESFTKPNWAWPTGTVPGAGGARQYFVPNRGLLVPITR
jgi:hypothetical protein